MIKLRPWQEARGLFQGIRNEGGQQIISLGCVGDILVEGVTVDAEQGEVIAVLRTDKGYRIRTRGGKHVPD